EAVQNQISIAGGGNAYRKSLSRLLKIEHARGDLNNGPKSCVLFLIAVFCSDNLPVVKKHASVLSAVRQAEDAGEPRILECLDRIEQTNRPQVTCKSHQRLLAG